MLRETRGFELIKVSSKSTARLVAGAIAGQIRQQGRAEIQAIGAGAINQAVKAIAIAGRYLENENVSIVAACSFAEVEIDHQERTAIRFSVDSYPNTQTTYPAARNSVSVPAF